MHDSAEGEVRNNFCWPRQFVKDGPGSVKTYRRRPRVDGSRLRAASFASVHLEKEKND